MKMFYVVTCMLLGFSAQASSVLEINAVNAGDVVQARNETYNIDFGSVIVNNRTTTRFTLRNIGTTPLVFVDASISGADFSGTHACRAGLQPNEVCSFTLSYWPMFEGSSSGRFVLNFTDDQVVFNLWGRGVRQ